AAFSRRMTGHVPFTIEELDLICNTLGISFEYITTGSREIPPPTPPAASFPARRQDAETVRQLRPADEPLTLAGGEVNEDAHAYVRLATAEPQILRLTAECSAS
ncbi:hypothetical protein B1T44_08470, partial [Mycobacterium persicum]